MKEVFLDKWVYVAGGDAVQHYPTELLGIMEMFAVVSNIIVISHIQGGQK